MNLPKTMLLFDYLRVDEKMTLKQECLLGFPKSPKEVERLISESIEEIEKFKHHAEIGRATEKVFVKGGWVQIPLLHDVDSVEDLLDWAKEDK